MLNYRGFVGTCEFSKEDNVYHGKILNVAGLLSYEGKTVELLKQDFEGVVDDYLASIKKRMLTVQQALAHVKHKKLINTYVEEYVPDVDVQRIGRKKIKKQLKHYLKWLQKQPVKEGNMVAFVSHMMKDEFLFSPRPDFQVQNVDELGDTSKRLGLEFTSVNETLGIKIAPTWKTQHYLYELLADLMNEMTFFGWHQEDLADEREKLEQSAKEAENDDVISADKFFKQLGFDRTKEDHFDSYEYQTAKRLLLEKNKVWLHSFMKEAQKVKLMLGLVK